VIEISFRCDWVLNGFSQAWRTASLLRPIVKHPKQWAEQQKCFAIHLLDKSLEQPFGLIYQGGYVSGAVIGSNSADVSS
jgi:hypothetical protein